MNYTLALTIGWLYPELMSTYGDHGNVITLQKRCEWRNIKAKVIELNTNFSVRDLKKCDLLMMGGAQDTQQEAVSKDLNGKSSILNEMILNGIPGIYICGAYQFLGNYYKEADGNLIEGLKIFDLYTENTQVNARRLIGNLAFRTKDFGTIVGFENHGGRTYLGKNLKPLGFVMKGFGNNGKDGTEGAVFKNSIGTYSHGPILPKNPLLADALLKKALDKKYRTFIKLPKLDDYLEQKARLQVAKRLSIAI